MKNSGFTLIEVLVSIGIVGVVGFILTTFLSQTFNGSNKTQLTGTLKQNGQASLNILDQSIRFSDQIICPTPSVGQYSVNSDTIVVGKGGVYTRFKFNLPSSNSNGSISMDNPLTIDPSINYCAQNQSGNIIYLTDGDLKNGVSISGGYFTRNIQSGSHDTVTVYFQVNPGLQSFNNLVEPIIFKTTIQQR